MTHTHTHTHTYAHRVHTALDSVGYKYASLNLKYSAIIATQHIFNP